MDIEINNQENYIIETEYYDLIKPNDLEKTELIGEVYEEVIDMVEEKDRAKKKWDYSNTHMFIELVREHLDDLADSRKKRHVFKNISKIMLEENTYVTPAECYRKWQNLIRTYKSVKKEKRTTLRFPFFDEMEELVGSRFQFDNETENDESCVEKRTTVENNSIEANEIVIRTCKSKRKDQSGLKDAYYAAKLEKLKKKDETWQRIEILIKKKLDLEERKVAALEKLVSLSQN